jgi:hypothetical protein
VLSIPPGPGKSLAKTLQDDELPSARRVASEWNALARIDVVEHGSTIPWLANPRIPAPLPPQMQIVIDGDAATPIVKLDGDPSELAFLDHVLPNAALRALAPERVLVIGAGGGLDVLGALRHGAEHVDAVEINPAIIEQVTGTYRDWGGSLFERDGVRLVQADGRSFVSRTEEVYDATQISLVDTWAATASGAYSLAESHLYTVEAFEDYLRHLTEDGFVTVSRWEWNPPRENLRLVTVAEAALRRIGARRPADHIAVLASGDLGTVVVKRSPFTPKELRAIAQVARDNAFFPVFTPERPAVNAFGAYLQAEDKSAFLRGYPYDVSPVTDDRPFFFRFGRWSQLDPLGDSLRQMMVVLPGRLVLVALLVQAGLLSVLLVLPALLTKKRGRAVGSAPAAHLVVAVLRPHRPGVHADRDRSDAAVHAVPRQPALRDGPRPRHSARRGGPGERHLAGDRPAVPERLTSPRA